MLVTQPFVLQADAQTVAGTLKDRAPGHLDWVVPTPRRRRAFPSPWLAAATQLPAVDPGAFMLEADAISSGRIERLDGATIDLGDPVDWVSTAVLDTRAQTHAAHPPSNDQRFELELHRHAHLIRLAQAWRLGHNPRHIAALLHHLERWFEQCHSPHSVAWASPLDAALRLLNWSIVWQLLGADQENSIVAPALRQRWLRSIYLHTRFVRHNRARHSAANNQLIGQLVGLVAAAATWPLWPEVERWGNAARSELMVQALRQTHADGASCEQASGYQIFVFELLAMFVHIERSAGRNLDERLLRRLGAMAVFIAALRDCKGQLSHHGDGDNARALHFTPGGSDACAQMIALAVDLRVAPELRPLVDGHADATPWLLGSLMDKRAANPVSRKERPAARAVLPRAFAHGGYHLLGSRFGEADEVLMTMDTGPLGYLGSAAHGHADALSLRLSVGGQPVLVDRGTFAHDGDLAWRRHFRGTLAHNTVCVDGRDQSRSGGPHLWRKHARVQLASFASNDAAGHVDAWHDGYGALSSPLVHRRRVEWHGQGRHFDVIDELHGDGPHKIAIAWHFDPNCEVTLSGDLALVRAGGCSFHVYLTKSSERGRWQLHYGDAKGHLGWHSPRLGVRVPAPSLVWRSRIVETAFFVTRFDLQTNEQNA